MVSQQLPSNPLEVSLSAVVMRFFLLLCLLFELGEVENSLDDTVFDALLG